MKTLLTEPAFSVTAWTGGSSPAKPSAISAAQAGIQKALFGQYVQNVTRFQNGTAPDWGSFRACFRDAYYNAHATYRTA